MVSQGQFSSKIMLIRIQQELLKTSYVIFRLFHGRARFPDLSPVEHVWDQLKRQMPSCHSVHDLQLVVQDLGTHLPQDNIRCSQSTNAGMYCSWRWSNALLKLPSICVIAHPVFA
ncbi:DDE_3 domain-containing protein [Trichonephila clavipes]|nr:DDE_3 domain-containing protein [Trichonephila clavipes]